MFLFIDKPKGITSFDCIRSLQRYYGKKIYDRKVKIGHAGTLDPMATGLMLVAIGKSTKKLGQMIGLDKTYVATIDLSQATDTWDADARGWKATWDGTQWNAESREQKIEKKLQYAQKPPFVPIAATDAELTEIALKWGYDFSSTSEIPTEDTIRKVLESFVGRQKFMLTPFSAKKIDGKKLYEYARAGNPILKSAPMNCISCELVSYSFPEITVRFEVGSGTYIRSLGFELGKALGRGGILTALRREKIGEWIL